MIAMCFKQDKLHDRLREMLYHAGIYCKDRNRLAIFLTSQWYDKIYDSHSKEVQKLRQNVVWKIIIFFIDKLVLLMFNIFKNFNSLSEE